MERFAFGAAAPETDAGLDQLEEALSTRLPSAYRRFATRYGAIDTSAILAMVAEDVPEHPDVQEFYTASGAIESTRFCWSGGMPDDVIGIASDCMGNPIGFRRAAEASDDAPVVFFDHDFLTVTELAPSFDAFLAWYLDRAERAG
ncbi:MAG: SMI1/KNR4 family protein [Phycisphaerae bacterium]|nr:SMI1/KNR4 family protein [Tepidisphaeraceae bacterium]